MFCPLPQRLEQGESGKLTRRFVGMTRVGVLPPSPKTSAEGKRETNRKTCGYDARGCFAPFCVAWELILVPWASLGALWELFWLLAGALAFPGRSLGAPWADRRCPWGSLGVSGGSAGDPWVSWGGPWGSLERSWGVLDALWGILGVSGALLGGLGGPQSDPGTVFKRSRPV